MCSLEKLKNLAVNQMRAAVKLYELCEMAEQCMENDDDDQRNKIFLCTQRDGRYVLLERRFGFKPTEEEKDLWDEIIEELD